MASDRMHYKVDYTPAVATRDWAPPSAIPMTKHKALAQAVTPTPAIHLESAMIGWYYPLGMIAGEFRSDNGAMFMVLRREVRLEGEAVTDEDEIGLLLAE